MTANTLEELLQSTANPAEMLRNNDLGWQPYVFRDEYTNWIEEQRAVRESVAVVDQSYHMEILEIEGPDAVDLLDRLGVNSFEAVRNGEPPQAINYLTCNPDGYVIGDVIVSPPRGGENLHVVIADSMNAGRDIRGDSREDPGERSTLSNSTSPTPDCRLAADDTGYCSVDGVTTPGAFRSNRSPMRTVSSTRG